LQFLFLNRNKKLEEKCIFFMLQKPIVHLIFTLPFVIFFPEAAKSNQSLSLNQHLKFLNNLFVSIPFNGIFATF